MMGVFKKIVYSSLAVVLFLALVEIVLRLSGMVPIGMFVDPVLAHGSWQRNLFAGFMGIHESDPELLWKMKPNLIKPFVKTNRHGLSGPEIPYSKPSGTLRIMLLGDSTPLGIGLANWSNSFVWILKQVISRYHNGPVEVVNASTAGYSSLQGLKYLEIEGLKYDPDIVLVYLGNNDASYNGFLCDSALMEKSAGYRHTRKFLNKFQIYRFLKNLLIPVKSGIAHVDDRELQVRVNPEQYAANLLEIYDLCQRNDIELILNTIPVPLTWPPAVEFKVFTEGRDSISGQLYMPELQRRQLHTQTALALDWQMFEENYGEIDEWSKHVLETAYTDTGALEPKIIEYRSELAVDPDDCNALNNLGVIFWRQSQYDSALVYLRQAVTHDPENPYPLYNLGMTFYRLQQADSAHYYLNSARNNDFNSLRIKENYNQVIVDLARQYDLPLVDLVALFDRVGREKLFVDHCHPNQLGHRLIAEKLAEEIVRMKR